MVAGLEAHEDGRADVSRRVNLSSGCEVGDQVANEILFEVLTPLGFNVRVSRNYWTLIVTIKHPVMRRREIDVHNTLKEPDEIRQSRNDPTVYLFYKLERPKRWICAVVKRLNRDGFLITTFPTDAIKEGQLIWSN